MKFIYEKQTKDKQLTLKDVENNQFFVCKNGYLCQKECSESYVVIADGEGNPSCECFDSDEDEQIQRILPRVEKIEF
jgi:hypothetical protein